jgi:hypothetical protein
MPSILAVWPLTLSMAFTLAACDDSSEKLKSCLASTEQTILLRQVTQNEKRKKDFESCRTDMGENYCRALYLNANGLVRQCMKDGGYSFIDPDFYLSRGENPWRPDGMVKEGLEGLCGWEQYDKPNCYQPTLWFQLTNWWAFRKGAG